MTLQIVDIAALLALAVLFVLCLVILAVLLRGRGVDSGPALAMLEKNQQRVEKAVREEIAANRKESSDTAQQARVETSRSLHEFSGTMAKQMALVAKLQKEQLAAFAQQLSRLTESNEQRLEKLRLAVEQKLAAMRADNTRKLEEMRSTVDEKLHSTLEKRLGDSFKLVSERLEQVHKGLGEMQELATGVGDLKRVLTNVKARGTWAEVQPGALLEETLTAEQHSANVATRKGSADRVEFAIRLPGRHLEDPQARVAPDRRQVPARGLRAAPGRPGTGGDRQGRRGLVDHLQREARVVVTGPTTLTALLNRLQMGFRTLAIERRSSEVWVTLSAVNNEFGKFGDILDKTKKKLQEATNTIDSASRKSRTIERKLRKVEVLPGPGEAAELL